MKNTVGYIVSAILLIGLSIQVSCQKELSCEQCNLLKHPPVANAGPDQYIVNPANITELDGRASTDPDNNISKYKWRNIAGPAGFKIEDATSAKTTVKNLITGIFRFELQVTDSTGLSSKDTVQVTVAADTPHDIPKENCYPASCRGYWICMPGDKFKYLQYTAPTNKNFPGAFGAAAANGNKLFFGGGHEEGYIGFAWSLVNIFDITSGSWATPRNLSVERSYLSAASCGNVVLFAGGNNRFTADPTPPYPGPPLLYYKTVDIFDANNYTQSVAALSEARGYMAAVSTPNQAFFIGGRTNNGYSSKMDMYDSKNKTWSVIELPRPRAHAGAVKTGNKIIIAGGVNADGNIKLADIYDLDTKTWSQMEIPHEHPFAAMALVQDKILIAGGDGLSNKSVDIYDLTTSTWASTELSDSRFDIAVAVANNTVIFLAGNYSCNVDIYKAETGKWQTIHLNDGVTGVVAASTGNICGFAGFLYQKGNALTNTVFIIEP